MNSEKVKEVFEKWGCFRVINHGVFSQLMAEMKLVASKLLHLSIEIKTKCGCASWMWVYGSQ